MGGWCQPSNYAESGCWQPNSTLTKGVTMHPFHWEWRMGANHPIPLRMCAHLPVTITLRWVSTQLHILHWEWVLTMHPIPLRMEKKVGANHLIPLRMGAQHHHPIQLHQEWVPTNYTENGCWQQKMPRIGCCPPNSKRSTIQTKNAAEQVQPSYPSMLDQQCRKKVVLHCTMHNNDVNCWSTMQTANNNGADELQYHKQCWQELLVTSAGQQSGPMANAAG